MERRVLSAAHDIMTRPTDASPASDPILRDLAPLIEGEVRTDPITRSLFATDASIFRRSPRAVVSPKTPEDVARVVAFANAQGIPVTARGGGSSLAGQAVGEGIILDFSTYMNRVLEVDLEDGWPESGNKLVAMLPAL